MDVIVVNQRLGRPLVTAAVAKYLQYTNPAVIIV